VLADTELFKIEPGIWMPRPDVFSFTRYLAAKKSVDDRALNRHVWETFQHHSAKWDDNRAMRLLEIGCGIGTMVERLTEWGALPELCEITAIDEQSENIREASGRLSKIPIPPVTLLGDDLYAFAAKNSTILWDVVVSNAVLDLLNIPEALRVMFSLLNPGGLFLFTINFDGVTIFEPDIDPIFDQEVL
jgi:2-polyprenyl-3-methyl-5-hydroxy-6-metoxy-1,4-benzoquinol methylase